MFGSAESDMVRLISREIILTYMITIRQRFAIFAAFKESMTLSLAQWSSKVIDFGTNRKRVHIFLLVVNSNLHPILHRFRDTAV